MNLNMFTFLLLAGAVGGPSEPKPEPLPKQPADPEREAALLSPPHVLPEEPTVYHLDTAIRIARQQGRDIDAYLSDHASDRAEELRRHRLSLLIFADDLADDLRSLRMAARPAPISIDPEAVAAEAELRAKGIDYDGERARYEQTVHRVVETLRERQNARPPPVRCPRRYCLAAPGKPCRGRSGNTAPVHPERERAAKRKEKA